VYRGIRATDPDDSVNGQVDFFVVPMPDNPLDGSNHFSVMPSLGHVVVNHSLDYERQHTYLLQIIGRVRFPLLLQSLLLIFFFEGSNIFVSLLSLGEESKR
jgi:hypothetical protein